MASRVTLLLVLILPALVSANVRPLGLAHGKFCSVSPEGTPAGPACSSPWACLINKVPPPNSKWRYSGNLNGTCNSKLLTAGSPPYCQNRSVYFAVGTKNMLDKSTCEKCTCTFHPEIPVNKAKCDCQKGSDCYVDRNGTAVIEHLCPSPEAPNCLLSKLNVRLSGKTVDRGNCVSGTPLGACTIVGSNFMYKLYANRTVGVPQYNNRCQSCTCLNSFVVDCKKIVGCKTP